MDQPFEVFFFSSMLIVIPLVWLGYMRKDILRHWFGSKRTALNNAFLWIGIAILLALAFPLIQPWLR